MNDVVNLLGRGSFGRTKHTLKILHIMRKIKVFIKLKTQFLH